MKALQNIIYEESRNRYPYQKSHFIEDDIKQDTFEQGAFWMKEHLFKRFKKELQKLTYQEYAGGPCERVIFDNEIEDILSKIENGDE